MARVFEAVAVKPLFFGSVSLRLCTYGTHVILDFVTADRRFLNSGGSREIRQEVVRNGAQLSQSGSSSRNSLIGTVLHLRTQLAIS